MGQDPVGGYVTPLSVKALVFDDVGRVLLGLNPREEWELPGGRPERGDQTLDDVLVREVAEETALVIRVGQLVGASLYEVVDGQTVGLVVYRCEIVSGRVMASDEHRAMEFFEPDALPQATPPVYRHFIDLTSRE